MTPSDRMQLSADARLVKDATVRWHHDFDGMERGRRQAHGSFSDSTAHTHCICWGAAWRMLEHIRSLPVDQRMAAMGLREATWRDCDNPNVQLWTDAPETEETK